MSDGFAPGNRIRDINPDGSSAEDAWAAEHGGPAESARGDAQSGSPARLTAGRGRRFVSSTTGAPTLDAATAAQTAPPAPIPFDWDSAEARAEQYDAKKAPRKGKRAERAYRQLLEERRRAEAERSAVEANREAKGVAGFRDASRHGSHVAMSNPEYTPSKMYEASDPTPPERGKRWYTRLVIIIPVVVVLVAGLVAGIGLPALAQARATAEANEAARQFTTELAAFEAAWTSENLQALLGPLPHAGIEESADALQQPPEAQEAFGTECGAVLADATRAATAMTDNPPPTLAVLPSASFSAAYRDAQQRDGEFAALRQTAQTLLGALSNTIAPIAAFCTNFQAGVTIENHASARDLAELEPLRTVAPGGVITIDNVQATCDDPLGCVDYANEEQRRKYAATWRSIQEERMESLIAHYRDACWLDVLKPYCTLMSDAWNEAKSGVTAAANAMEQLQVSDEPGQPPFPRLAEATAEMNHVFQEVADKAKLEAGSVDPESLLDVEPGWETRMLIRLVTQYETHLATAVTDYAASASA
ncbi:hypothetical protein GCM10011490_06890 [Pseudoclavibacter endophyticus]|uniref:Uncharacterized protein n=1 Tax=Pseudoclavibacter endophyticus TaxID=1778590 RepID=A0A6H9WTR9_9MICO|nr:hypothetical protein [Pseudoclavibacter endophyticus]KAB1649824.1 hypothetical protein F8O04_06235 [Pseudoclavibacter endophyticus]GGA59478.1 hypothetical protein GCM10011490_06890 [Pseudoclavibacter endophyticus]